MRRLKNYILNLFGIEAVLPKGTAYILFQPYGIIRGTAPSLCANLIMMNVDYEGNEEDGTFTITPKMVESK